MAENVREIQPPEPPPKPLEVPNPTEQSDGPETRTQAAESQQSVHEEMRNAARAEYAKATSTEGAVTPVEEVPPRNIPVDTGETDKSAENAARLDELRSQGHGPQRHHDPTDEQLTARLGDPILDPQSDEPLLKENGRVRAQNQIDPMTGTTVDGVSGGTHRCGDYATRIDAPEDYVTADRYMRTQVGQTGPAAVRRPISEVLGPGAHERMTGYYHDPDVTGRLKPVDFTGGTVFAVYQRLPSGDLHLRTMYVDPAPANPDQ